MPPEDPPDSAPSTAVPDPMPDGESRPLDFFGAAAASGLILVLVTGLLALLSHWLGGANFTRLWLQLSTTVTGLLFCLAAGILALPRFSRLLLASGGLLLLLAVVDSADRQQNLLPIVSIHLSFWAGLYAYITAQIMQRSKTYRHWLAIGLGSSAMAVYLGSACYYVLINQWAGLVDVNQHPLYMLGIVISSLLKWVGEIRISSKPPRNTRTCAQCGLPNIQERRTCKRCGSLLDLLQQSP